MSGIAGMFRFNGALADKSELASMGVQLQHRGRDGQTLWQSGSIGFVYLQHCVTTESLLEQQPLQDERASITLVMDGRIDNWEELRKTLRSRGVNLQDSSDSELVLKAYQKWGEQFLQHIEGDFALAIWDEPRKRLVCARDPMGNKPLCYYRDETLFAFASEPNALFVLPEVEKIPSEALVAECLALEWRSRDLTFWQGISRLEPGHCLVTTPETSCDFKFWEPRLDNPLNYVRDSDYSEHYLELLSRTVRRLSRSHQPIACEVSGGLDSSAIFAVASQQQDDDRLLAPELRGYTLNFSGDADADEVAYSRAVAAHCRRAIREIKPHYEPLDWYRQRSREIAGYAGAPNAIMSLGMFRQASSDGCRVILNGIGGDEWLGASRVSYTEELAMGRWAVLRDLLVDDAHQHGWPRVLAWLLRRALVPHIPAGLKSRISGLYSNHVTAFDTHRWLQPSQRNVLNIAHGRSDTSSGNREYRWPGQAGEIAVLEGAYSAIAHETMESLATAAGLEIRRPYWTPSMVQFSIDVPKRFLFRSGLNRYLHRQALVGLLPGEVLARTTKAEFSSTFERYAGELFEECLPEILGRRGHWVSAARAYSLAGRRQQSRYDGWADRMFWMLFACDAVLSTE